MLLFQGQRELCLLILVLMLCVDIKTHYVTVWIILLPTKHLFSVFNHQLDTVFVVGNQIMDLDEDIIYLKLRFGCLYSTSPWRRARDVPFPVKLQLYLRRGEMFLGNFQQ